MSKLTHHVSHHFHGPVAAVIQDDDKAPMIRIYPAGGRPWSANVDIYLHDATNAQIAAFKALAAALAAQDVPVKEDV